MNSEAGACRIGGVYYATGVYRLLHFEFIPGIKGLLDHPLEIFSQLMTGYM